MVEFHDSCQRSFKATPYRTNHDLGELQDRQRKSKMNQPKATSEKSDQRVALIGPYGLHVAT